MRASPGGCFSPPCGTVPQEGQDKPFPAPPINRYDCRARALRIVFASTPASIISSMERNRLGEDQAGGRPGAAATPQSALLPALARLAMVRWLSLAILTGLGGLSWEILRLDLPYRLLALVLVMQAAFNLYTSWRCRQGGPPGMGELCGHIVADLSFLGLLLYFTGGWLNPFVSFLLVPVVLAAAVLPPALAVACGFYGVLIYSLLARYYVVLPVAGERAMRLHILGMWFNFVLSAGIIILFMLRLRRELGARDAALERAREQVLRDERLLALGIQAASTAHELATPLNTLALGVENLPLLPAIQQREEIRRMGEQIARCKAVLQGLREAGRRGPQAAALGPWLGKILRDWEAARPQIRVELGVDDALASRVLMLDDVLRQAIFNLLDNAARASSEPLRMAVRQVGEAVELEILDRGPGYEPQDPLAPRGIGLLLTRAAVERLGGRLALDKRAQGGTRAAILLPLTNLS